MILSPTAGIVFFKPVKTAGSSIEFALAQSCGPNDLLTGGMEGAEKSAGFLPQNNEWVEDDTLYRKFHTHTFPAVLEKRMTPEQFSEIEQLKWITMTRNPWDAVVSYYWWNMRSIKNEKRIINEKSTQKQASDMFHRTVFSIPVELDSTNNTNMTDFFTLFDFVAKHNIQMAMDPRIDHIIRFEHLQEDFDKVTSELYLHNVPIPRFKTTQKKVKKHYSFYYNDITKRIVGDAFKDYIEKFDYKFEYKSRKLSRRDRSKRRKDKKV
jgi:hypothetical protein